MVSTLAKSIAFTKLVLDTDDASNIDDNSECKFCFVKTGPGNGIGIMIKS